MIKRSIFSISLIAAIFSNASFAANSCTQKIQGLTQEGDQYFAGHRYLLAMISYSGAAAVDCNTPADKAQLGQADSLFFLGEKEAARAKWKSLLDGKAYESTKLIAASRLAFEFGEVPSQGRVKEAYALWGARSDYQSFQNHLDHAPLSPSEKLTLKSLRADFSRPYSPLLAGALSAVLPGAGQAYTGAYESAGIALVLNSLFLLSTTELAKKKMGFTAAISGAAFSTVYLGNLISAVQGAKKQNQIREIENYRPLREELEAISVKSE